MLNDECRMMSEEAHAALSSFSILHSDFCISSVLLNMIPARLAAEQFAADPHHGGALGDRQLEIVAHTHRQVPQARPADLMPFQLVEDLAGAAEALADRLF